MSHLLTRTSMDRRSFGRSTILLIGSQRKRLWRVENGRTGVRAIPGPKIRTWGTRHLWWIGDGRTEVRESGAGFERVFDYAEHLCFGSGFSGPDFELAGSLLDEHFNAADGGDSALARQLEQGRLHGVV